MHILIVFDDIYGVIKSIVTDILNVLYQEKIQVYAKSVDEVDSYDIDHADFVLIGSPTTPSGPSQNINKFFINFANHLRGKACSSFTAIVKGFLPGSNRSANSRLIKYMAKLSCKMSHKTQNFYIDTITGPLCNNEDQRIKNYAKYLWMF